MFFFSRQFPTMEDALAAHEQVADFLHTLEADCTALAAEVDDVPVVVIGIIQIDPWGAAENIPAVWEEAPEFDLPEDAKSALFKRFMSHGLIVPAQGLEERNIYATPRNLTEDGTLEE